MTLQHLVRVGAMGQVGGFVSSDATIFPRRSRVICRTSRGLETGEVLGHVQRQVDSDGTVLRGMTVEDDLLLAHLEKHRSEAIRACTQLLESQGCTAVLLDVEQLFDGSALYFYFLGQVPEELERTTHELATTYATTARIHQLHQALTEGCGPGCGTEEKAGCGSEGGCGSCAVASACRTTAR